MKRWSVLAIVAIWSGFPTFEIACAYPSPIAQQPQTNAERLKTYLQKRDYEGGVAWLETLAPGESRDDLARSLAQSAWEHGYYRVARQSLENIDALYIRVQMLRSLADAHLAVGQQQDAREIAAQAFELSQKTDEFSPHSWVEMFLKTGQEDRVKAIVNGLNRETPPNDSDRFQIATAYFKVGRYAEAFEFARLIRDRALLPDDYPDPKVELLNSIINRALRDGRVDFALDVTQVLNEKSDRARALQRIARNLESAGKRDRAFKVLERAIAVTKTIESLSIIADRHTFWAEPNASLLMNLAEDSAQWGRKQQALSVLSLARQSILGFENQYAFSYPAWNRSASLQRLALLYQKLGEKEAAGESVAIALKEVEKLEGVRHQITELLAIAQLSPKLDQPRLGEEVLAIAVQKTSKIEEMPDRIEQLLKIAEICVELKNFTQAVSIVERAGQLSKTLEPSDRATRLSLKIANLTGQISKPENALPLLNELRPKLDSIAAKIFAISIYQTLLGQEEITQDLITKTIRQIEALEQDYQRIQEFKYLVRTIASPNSPQLALEAIQQATQAEDRVKLLVTLAQYYAANQQNDLASKLATQALTTANAIPDRNQRNGLLIEAARTLASWSGNSVPSGWEWRYPLAIKIAQHLSNSGVKDSILLNIASNYLKAGEEETALRTLALVPEKDPQDILQTAMDLEKYDIALQIVREFSNRDRTIVFFRQIAQKSALSGNKEQAIAILSEATALVNQLENSPRKTHLLNAIAQQQQSFERE